MIVIMDIRQRLAIGTLGLGYVALKHMMPQRCVIHERLRDEADLLQWNRGLVISLSDLMNVSTDTDRLLTYVHEYRRHDQSDMRTASFHMNRIMHDINAEISRLLKTSSGSMTTRDLREQLYVEQDVVPVIRSHLESILHNHMLKELM